MRRSALFVAVCALAACGSSKSNPDGRLHTPDAMPADAPPPPIDAMPPDAPPPDAMPGVTTLEVSNGTATITSVSFADSPLGAHAGFTVFITNIGTTATTALATTLTGANAADFSIDAAHSSCAGATLGPADLCKVALVFTPGAAGKSDATLHVTGVAVPLDLPLTGNGTAATTGFVVDTAALDFGVVETNQHGDATLLLSNSGNTTLTLGARTANNGFSVAGDNCPAQLTMGGACTVTVRFSPTTGGLATGMFTAMAGSTTLNVALRGVGARRVTVTLRGGGGGRVTSVPSGIDCGTTCTGLFIGTVTLTETPGTGAMFTGWSNACATQTTCLLAPADGTVALDARFEAAGAKRIDIGFAGAALGLVQVKDVGSGQTLVTCSAACTTYVASGTQIDLRGFTPSTFSGWTSDCTSSTHDCNLGTVVNDRSATVTFDKDPQEVTTLLLATPITGLAFEPGGDLVIADATGVTRRTQGGSVVWTRAITGGAKDLATDAAGDVVGIGTNAVFKLTSAGVVSWSKPITAGRPGNTSIESAIAVSPDGKVIAALTTSGAHVVDDTGSDRFVVSTLNGATSVAVDTAGDVAIAVPSVAHAEQIKAVRFDKTGAALASIDPLPGDEVASIVYDASGNLCADTTGHGHETASCADDAGANLFTAADNTGAAGPITAGVVVDSTGRAIAVRGAVDAALPGVEAQAFTIGGAVAWSIVKAPGENFPFSDGVAPFAIAADNGKHVAIAGTWALTTPWIEIFALP